MASDFTKFTTQIWSAAFRRQIPRAIVFSAARSLATRPMPSTAGVQGREPGWVYLSGGLCCASRCAKAETSLNDRLRRIHHRGRIFPSTPSNRIDVRFQDGGEITVKNIDQANPHLALALPLLSFCRLTCARENAPTVTNTSRRLSALAIRFGLAHRHGQSIGPFFRLPMPSLTIEEMQIPPGSASGSTRPKTVSIM